MHAGERKAGLSLPNNARALIESQARGFGNCVVLDLLRQCRRACDGQYIHR